MPGLSDVSLTLFAPGGLGVRSIAVPLVTREGAVAAAMSISTRAERMTVAEMVRSYLPALLRNQAWARGQALRP